MEVFLDEDDLARDTTLSINVSCFLPFRSSIISAERSSENKKSEVRIGEFRSFVFSSSVRGTGSARAASLLLRMIFAHSAVSCWQTYLKDLPPEISISINSGWVFLSTILPMADNHWSNQYVALREFISKVSISNSLEAETCVPFDATVMGLVRIRSQNSLGKCHVRGADESENSYHRLCGHNGMERRSLDFL